MTHAIRADTRVIGNVNGQNQFSMVSDEFFRLLPLLARKFDLFAVDTNNDGDANALIAVFGDAAQFDLYAILGGTETRNGVVVDAPIPLTDARLAQAIVVPNFAVNQSFGF